MSVSHIFAGIPVADLQAGVNWYERVFGKPPDMSPNDQEAVWHMTASASVYVVRDPGRAGKALLTVAVSDLQQLIAQLADRGLPDRAIQRTTGPPPTVIVTDAEGNRVTFFEDPAAAR
jgi:hypothetical protein